MKPEQTVEALEQAASQLGVQVRYETMTGDASGSGGLCKIRGNWCVIMDRKTPPAERAATLIDALTGPLYFRRIIGHAPVSEAFANELASRVLQAFRRPVGF